MNNNKRKYQIVDNLTAEEREQLKRKRLTYFVIGVDIALVIFIAIQVVLLVNDLLTK
ncbi:MAG: hypothetical protein GX350_02030 [Erysipelotrichaceae bacterium]|nr:hypothetical protein [Erysipelotrichaceae bacterium]